MLYKELTVEWLPLQLPGENVVVVFEKNSNIENVIHSPNIKKNKVK